HQRRDPGADAQFRRHLRTDHRHGDPRCARRRNRRPHPLPRRRPDREGARPLRRARGHLRPGRDRSQMIKVALKGLAGRKLRASLSAFAIILGVAMVSGTFVLTDTMNGAFDSIITQSYKNADVVVSGKTAFNTDSNGNTVQPPSFPESVLAKIRALPDVNAAAGSLTDDKTKLVGRDGKVVATGGAPNLAFSVDPNGDQRFNPLEVTAGHWPEGPNQVAIDSGTASKQHYAVGDTIGIRSRAPLPTAHAAGLPSVPAA